jgi:hypothetical protein
MIPDFENNSFFDMDNSVIHNIIRERDAEFVDHMLDFCDYIAIHLLCSKIHHIHLQLTIFLFETCLNCLLKASCSKIQGRLACKLNPVDTSPFKTLFCNRVLSMN